MNGVQAPLGCELCKPVLRCLLGRSGVNRSERPHHAVAVLPVALTERVADYVHPLMHHRSLPGGRERLRQVLKPVTDILEAAVPARKIPATGTGRSQHRHRLKSKDLLLPVRGDAHDESRTGCCAPAHRGPTPPIAPTRITG